jgi:hypothetical protein
MHVQLSTAIIILLISQLGAPPKPAPSDAADESVELRYARAQLQLAEASLKRVQQINSRLARSVPVSVVAEFEQSVAVAKTKMQLAQAGNDKDGFQVWLRRAEVAWKSADTTWKNSAAVNKRAPGTFEVLDIERFRLRAELTRLQFERGQLLAGASREAQVQWQLDGLNYEVERLKEESSRVAPFVRYYPSWWR